MSRVVSALLPVIAWMAFVYVMSTDVGSFSSTGRIIGPLLRWFDPDVTPETIAQVQLLVRKGAHLVEYAVLALLILRAVAMLRPIRELSFARGAFIAVAVSAIYACTDEIHQSFVASRSGSIVDVAIDTVGACTGVAIALVWRRCFRRSRPDAEPVPAG